MPLSQRARNLSDEMEQYFVVPMDFQNESKSALNILSDFPDSFRTVGDTFVDRLNATLQTTATPFLLANVAAQDKKFQALFMTEKIRARGIIAKENEDEEALEKRRSAIARQIAKEKFSEFGKSDEGIDVLVIETSNFLLGVNKDHGINLVAGELLLQGAVSIWSAFETLVRDSLVLLLNEKPTLSTKLLTDPIAKKRFEMPKLNLDELAPIGFDLSRQMGRILFEERDFSNLITLKCACDSLIAHPPLKELLNSPLTWKINQNRHLIAHRRGIVDEDYLKKIRSELKIGEQLRIQPYEFQEQLNHVLVSGAEFLIGLKAARENA